MAKCSIPGLCRSPVSVAPPREADGLTTTRHDRLAEPPAGFNHDRVGAVRRVPGKEDTSALGGHQLLDNDPDPRLAWEPKPLPVSEHRLRVRRSPDRAHRIG